MQIIARTRISGLLESLMVGIWAIAGAVPLLSLAQPLPWYVIPIGIYLLLFGAFWIVCAAKWWWPRGIGLAFTPNGIVTGVPFGLPWKPWMISFRWDDIQHAQYVSRREVRFARPPGAVILELRAEAPAWPNTKSAKKVSKRLQKQLGQSLSDNVFALVGPWWDWQPEEVAAWINESIADPERRSRWETAATAATV